MQQQQRQWQRRMWRQQVCVVPSSSANPVNLKSPAAAAAGWCSAPGRSLGGTFPHRAAPSLPPGLFRLREPNANSPGRRREEGEGGVGARSASPPRCGGVRLRAGSAAVPTTAGDRDDKAEPTYSGGVGCQTQQSDGGVMRPIHAGVALPLPGPALPLVLCGLTGRSSPVNLIYPLFRLCLPPASHIFST